MDLTTTLNGAASNSYVDLDDATDLAEQLAAVVYLGVNADAFLAADEDVQTRVLVMGCRRIDTLLFDGVRQLDTQALAFPRTYTGRFQTTGVVPDAVKEAQVAEACALMNAPSEMAAAQSQGIQSFTNSEQSVTFRNGGTVGSAGPRVSPAAEQILRDAGLIAGGVGSVYMPR